VYSATLAEKLGFRREDLLLDNLRVENIWRDEMLYRSSRPTASAKPDFIPHRLRAERGARKPRYPDQCCVLAHT